jgi:hypothetical protein
MGDGKGEYWGEDYQEKVGWNDHGDHMKEIPWPSTKFWRTLVMFDHFWDFDRLVEDGAPRRSGDHGISPPFAGFLGLGFM